MGACREDRGTRTSACTDISLLACTPENNASVSTVWGIRVHCGKPSAFAYHSARGLAQGSRPLRGLPRHAGVASEQPGFRETQIARCTEDEMIVHRNV